MLSPADMLIIGTAALLFFGPDQLPKVARRAGQVVREVQATSTSFIREMERAADEPSAHAGDPYHPPQPYLPEPYTPAPYAHELDAVPLDPIVKTGHEKSAPASAEPPTSLPLEPPHTN